MDESGFFAGKRLNAERAISYGFTEEDGGLVFSRAIAGGQFVLRVTVAGESVTTRLTDAETGDEYVLHLLPQATGAFVGRVKAEYAEALSDIATACCDAEVFKEIQTKAVIAYSLGRYGSAPEYLWQKFPDNAVLRRADNKKWFAALLTVRRSRLALAGEGSVEILDLRVRQEKIDGTVDGVRVLPGYHMNKKHWVTVCLDGRVETDEILRMLDESYTIAGEK